MLIEIIEMLLSLHSPYDWSYKNTRVKVALLGEQWLRTLGEEHLKATSNKLSIIFGNKCEII